MEWLPSGGQHLYVATTFMILKCNSCISPVFKTLLINTPSALGAINSFAYKLVIVICDSNDYRLMSNSKQYAMLIPNKK